MNILLVSTGEHFQDKDLVQATKKLGHALDIRQIDKLSISDTQEIASLIKPYNVVYWRVGNPNLREITARIAHTQNVHFINSGYFKIPSLGNKSIQLLLAHKSGIAVPKTLLVSTRKTNNFEYVENRLGTPFVVKRIIGAKGTSVWKISNTDELDKIIDNEQLNEYLAQEFIKADGDFRVLVVGGKAIGAMKRKPAERGEFRANISLGGFGEPIEDKTTKEKIFPLAQKAARALSLEIAGIDFIQDKKGNFHLIETNSIPQWEGFKKATKIDVAVKIVKYFESLVISKSNP